MSTILRGLGSLAVTAVSSGCKMIFPNVEKKTVAVAFLGMASLGAALFAYRSGALNLEECEHSFEGRNYYCSPTTFGSLVDMVQENRALFLGVAALNLLVVSKLSDYFLREKEEGVDRETQTTREEVQTKTRPTQTMAPRLPQMHHREVQASVPMSSQGNSTHTKRNPLPGIGVGTASQTTGLEMRDQGIGTIQEMGTEGTQTFFAGVDVATDSRGLIQTKNTQVGPNLPPNSRQTNIAIQATLRMVDQASGTHSKKDPLPGIGVGTGSQTTSLAVSDQEVQWSPSQQQMQDQMVGTDEEIEVFGGSPDGFYDVEANELWNIEDDELRRSSSGVSTGENISSSPSAPSSPLSMRPRATSSESVDWNWDPYDLEWYHNTPPLATPKEESNDSSLQMHHSIQNIFRSLQEESTQLLEDVSQALTVHQNSNSFQPVDLEEEARSESGSPAHSDDSELDSWFPFVEDNQQPKTRIFQRLLNWITSRKNK